MGYGNHRSLWGSRDRSFRRGCRRRRGKNAAGVPKNAIDALLSRLDNISHDPDMTTAKKAIVAADAIEKFNQQYKGKSLTVRLKVQDVVPYGQGHCLTANRPDLDGVQFYTGKFQTSLSERRSHVGHQGQRVGGYGHGQRRQSAADAHQVVRNPQTGRQHRLSLARQPGLPDLPR